MFQKNMNKQDLELMEDVGRPRVFFSPCQLELVSFLKEGEWIIKGKELVKRAKTLNACLGEGQARHLCEHQKEIPKKWRQYDLIFPGTIWRDRYGNCFMICLFWAGRYGRRWIPFLNSLDSDFGPFGRLLRPRQ